MPSLNRFPDTQSFIAITLVVAVVALAFTLVVLGKTVSDTFKIMVGGIRTVGFASIVGFYFGSSQGSKTKDETISAMANGAQPSAAPLPPAAPSPSPPNQP